MESIAASRNDLTEKFIDIMGTREEPETRVYFQPPPSVKLKYDCIKYSMVGMNHRYANNKIYTNMNRYEIIVISFDPENDIAKRILESFELCSFDRRYIADNLVHDVLTLYH